MRANAGLISAGLSQERVRDSGGGIDSESAYDKQPRRMAQRGARFILTASFTVLGGRQS